MQVPIKQIITSGIEESVYTSILRNIAIARKPFKKLGKVEPKHHDISSLDNKGGSGKLFSYDELLKNDTRPKRT